MPNIPRHGVSRSTHQRASRPTHDYDAAFYAPSSGADSAAAQGARDADLSPTVGPGTRITDLINGPATVTINEDGITIEDGALTLKDEFGETTLVSSGFAGAWNDYIGLGLYNPVFAAGVDGELPAGRTASLPYWTITRNVGSPSVSRVADTAYPGNHKVRITFASVSDEVFLESDPVPCVGGMSYGVAGVVGWNKTTDAASWAISMQVRFYDAAGTYISAGSFGGTDLDPGTGAGTAGTSAAHVVQFTQYPTLAPLTARYMTYRIRALNSTHDVGAHYWDIGLARIGIASAALSSDWYSAKGLFLTGGAGEGQLLIGDNLSNMFEANFDGSFGVTDYAGGGTYVDTDGLISPYRGDTFDTFNPLLTGDGTATYSYKRGWYVTLGKLCFISFDFQVNSAGSGGTTITPEFPAAILPDTSGGNQVLGGFAQGFSTFASGPVVCLLNAAGIAAIRDVNNGSLSRSHFAANALVRVTGVYRIA